MISYLLKRSTLASLILGFSINITAQTIDFDEVLDSNLIQIDRCRIAMADMDADHDLDLIIVGYTDDYDEVAHLYRNNGIGGFELVENTNIQGSSQGAVVFDDLDGDNDPDLIISGFTGSSGISHKTQMYTNDGTGVFTKVLNTPFEKMYNGDLALIDVDGDTDLDLVEIGYKSYDEYIAKLYINDGAGSFSEKSNTPFTPVTQGNIAVANVDGDSDLDFLITGLNLSGNRVAELYLNDGTGNFTLALNTPFAPMYDCDVKFFDADGDLDQDLLMSGYSSSTIETILYTNDGAGVFTKNTNSSFAGLYRSDIITGDIDQDNDLDIIICGDVGGFSYRTYVYQNDGVGNFTLAIGTPFVGVHRADLILADFDSDSDLDLILSGNTKTGPITKAYENMNTISGVFEFSNQEQFDVFPNPFKNGIQITSSSPWDSVKIYSTSGLLIETISRSKDTIDLTTLEPGLYVIEFQNQGATINRQQLIKN